MTMGKMQAKATNRILDRLAIPNHRTKIGIKAILGEGNPRATRGSINHSAKRLRAISSPIKTPRRVAKISPANARPRLSARSVASVPSASECHNWSATEENGGKNKGGVRCARAASSQISNKTKIDAAERQLTCNDLMF